MSGRGLFVACLLAAATAGAVEDWLPFRYATKDAGDCGPGDKPGQVLERILPPVVRFPNEKLLWRRIYAFRDFNCDGKVDLLLSEDRFGKGTGGFSFYLYLGDGSNAFHRVDLDIGGNSVAVERLWDRNRIWTNWHTGGGESVLSVFDIGTNGYTKEQRLVIHPGDGGTDMGNAIFSAVFNGRDAVKFCDGPERVKK